MTITNTQMEDLKMTITNTQSFVEEIESNPVGKQGQAIIDRLERLLKEDKKALKK